MTIAQRLKHKRSDVRAQARREYEKLEELREDIGERSQCKLPSRRDVATREDVRRPLTDSLEPWWNRGAFA